MSGGLRRSLAELACGALQATLPPSMQPWGWAVRCETAAIPDDTKALLFALDSLRGLMPRAVASQLLRPFASLIGDEATFSGGLTTMNVFDSITRRPRSVGVACAIGAVASGLAYMMTAGAPARYLGTNICALVIGLTTLALLGHKWVARERAVGGAIAAMAIALLATALLGVSVDGATRWIRLGGVSLQPSLILAPVMLATFARCRSGIATAGMIGATAAMAIQPDRAMAGMLAAGLTTLAIMRPDRHVVTALGTSIASFAVTMFRADTQPAVSYVDQILYSSFDVHIAAGAMVLGGSVLLLVPAIIGWRRDPANRANYAAFGAVWLAAIMAAALGNYPTPIVGYGGSAIIGYALSLLALPKRAGATTEAASQEEAEGAVRLTDRHLLVGLA